MVDLSNVFTLFLAKRRALFLIFFLLNCVAFSQENLIINPSFEIQSTNPYYVEQWMLDNYAPHPITGSGWESIHFSVEYYPSIDIYIPYPSNLTPLGYTYPCPTTDLCIYPYHGQYFAGMYLYCYFADNPDQKDVIRGTFSSPLIEGKKYQLKFYINNIGSTCMVKEASLSLANSVDFESTLSILSVAIPTNPQHEQLRNFLVNNTVSKIKIENTRKKNEWIPVTSSFVASGGEKYFYIHAWDIPMKEYSNPNSSLIELGSEVDTTNFQWSAWPVHYAYFDNFSLVEKPYFPTIITVDEDTLNNSFHYSSLDVPCNITIYNRWGQKTGAITPENRYYYSDIPGTYFYTGTCDSFEEKGYFEIVKE